MLRSDKAGSRQSAVGSPATIASSAFVIFLIALAVRLVHLWLMSATPYFSVLMGDARGYDTWARTIAGGDWIGHEVFYQAPLYPYFIGAIYTVSGPDVGTLRIAQAVVGASSCVLLAYAGMRWFSPRVGFGAGLALALYAPAIFFDGIIQKSVLDVFFVCAALALFGYLIPGGSKDPPLRKKDSEDAPLRKTGSEDPPLRQRTDRRSNGHTDRRSNDHRDRRSNDHIRRGGSSDPPGARSVWAWMTLGVVIGCLSLTRENALLLVGVVGVWAFMRARRTAVWFLVGVAVALGPVAVRNYAVGGGFYLTTSQFGSNFYIGNNPKADGTYMSLRFGRGSPEYERVDATELAERALARTLTPGEVSAYWTDRALQFIAAEPLTWLRLQARKIALLINATEMVDTESQEAHAEYSWPVWLLSPITHFGVLVPLALLGMYTTWSSRRRLWILYAVVLTYGVSTIIFFVFARYRYPLVPVLLLFAVAGLAALPAMLRMWRTSPRRAIPIGVALLVTAVAANWPLLSTTRMRAITATNLGTAMYENGRLEDAAAAYRRALEIQLDYAPAYNNLGVVLRAEGQVDRAIASYQEGLRLNDDYPDLHFNLANALLEQNRAEEAAHHLRVASAGTPDSAGVHNNLGKALAERGQLAEAAKEFQTALILEPDSVMAHRNLGLILPSLGRVDEAMTHLQRAVEIEPSNVEARYDLGSLWLERGRFADAATEFHAAIAARPNYVEARNNLGIALASQGKIAEAVAAWEEALRINPDFADAKRNLEMARRGTK